MRTEAEIREKLKALKCYQKDALESGRVWSYMDVKHQVKELEWVLS